MYSERRGGKETENRLYTGEEKGLDVIGRKELTEEPRYGTNLDVLLK